MRNVIVRSLAQGTTQAFSTHSSLSPLTVRRDNMSDNSRSSNVHFLTRHNPSASLSLRKARQTFPLVSLFKKRGTIQHLASFLKKLNVEFLLKTDTVQLTVRQPFFNQEFETGESWESFVSFVNTTMHRNLGSNQLKRAAIKNRA